MTTQISVGSAVEVYSASSGAWQPATVVEITNCVAKCSYTTNGMPAMKDLPLSHPHLRVVAQKGAGGYAGSPAQGTWDQKQSKELQRGTPILESLQDKLLKETSSVREAVGGLNSGRFSALDGICLVFSNTKNMYFVLWRSDKKDAVVAMLQIMPVPRPPIGTRPTGLRKVKRSSTQLLENETKTLDQLGTEARENYKRLSLAVHSPSATVLGPMIDSYFRSGDKNNDGKIDLEECKGVIADIYELVQLTPPSNETMEMIFMNYDTNNNHFIGREEFAMMFGRTVKRALSQFKVTGKEDFIAQAKRDFKERFELGKRLAAGAQGTTYLATEKASGRKVVVKKPFDTTDTADFDMLRDKSHPNIVRVFELFTSPTETFVVMEFCGGGDLFKAMAHCREEFKGMTYNFIASCVQQTMKGINYLHIEFKASHNDIKPENVLLEHKPKDLNDFPRCMVADFGCVQLNSGDWRYAAPELWPQMGGSKSYASDVWALGVMLFEMLSGGYLPCVDYPNVSGWEAFTKVDSGKAFRQLAEGNLHKDSSGSIVGLEPHWYRMEAGGVGSLQTDLCKSMLRRARENRIVLRDAIQHKWFDCIKEARVYPLPQDIIDKLDRRSKLSELKIALLNLVASRLQGECLNFYRSLWDKFDMDKNGVLAKEDFIKLLGSPEINIHDAQAEELHSMADVDGNGTVDFNEFVAIMFDPDELQQDQLEEHFKGIFFTLAGRSTNLNGTGSKAVKCGKCCPSGHSLWMNYTPEDGYKCDRDGAIMPKGMEVWSCRMCNFDICNACYMQVEEHTGARITLEELESIFPEHMSKTLIRELFTEIDTDNSGSIDYEEFSKFLRSM